jgi:hypothetical protein
MSVTITDMSSPMPSSPKKKYFVFSDESGSWHDPKDIYVRAWVVVSESGYNKLMDAMDYIVSELGCTEVKSKTLAGNPRFFDVVDKFNCRIFLTVSSPADIKWESKYKITRDFETQVEAFDFGELDADLIKILKKKMYDDIRNVLFLKFYEKTHIQNAKQGIDKVLSANDNLLIYRVDPPQMSKNSWKDILHAISPDVQIEFPKSQTDSGIQFADIVAGCVRSFLISDAHLEESKLFIQKIRPKFIKKDAANPNPNLIFFKEISEGLRNRSGEIWAV